MAHPIAQSEADPAKQNQAESNTHEHSGTQRQFRFLALPRRFRLFGVKQSSHTVPPNSRAHPNPSRLWDLDEFYGFSEGGAASDPILFNSVSNSIGSGNTMVVFFSTPISVSVCR